MKVASLFGLAIAMVAASPVQPYQDIGDHAPGLLSIVSFSYEADCATSGVAISTGTWSNTTNHCSPISGATKTVVSAKVVFLDKGCQIHLYNGEDCTGEGVLAEVDSCAASIPVGQWKKFSLRGCAAFEEKAVTQG